MQEKRISVRTDMLGVHARLSTNGRIWTEVTVHDISDSGLGFISDNEIKTGATFMLNCSVTDFVKDLTFECDLKIIFAGKTPDGHFLYGSKFVGLEHAHHVELSIFVEMMLTKYPPLLYTDQG